MKVDVRVYPYENSNEYRVRIIRTFEGPFLETSVWYADGEDSCAKSMAKFIAGELERLPEDASQEKIEKTLRDAEWDFWK